MAPPRIIDPEGYVHVGSRGNFGRALYEDPSHRTTFLLLYARVARDLGWTTLAYCLMTNHYHFLIRLTDGGLSEGMQQLNGTFSRRMNALHDRTGGGHLFKNRFDGTWLNREGSSVSLNQQVKPDRHLDDERQHVDDQQRNRDLHPGR